MAAYLEQASVEPQVREIELDVDVKMNIGFVDKTRVFGFVTVPETRLPTYCLRESRYCSSV